MKDFYSLSEVADMLGTTKETLRRWDKSGKLVPVRHPINNYRVYRPKDLEQFEKIGFMFRVQVELDDTPFKAVNLHRIIFRRWWARTWIGKGGLVQLPVVRNR